MIRNGRILLCLVLGQLFTLPSPVWSAKVEFCGQSGECLCISWKTNTGGYVEVRCPLERGWTNDILSWHGKRGTFVDQRGSFYGNGLPNPYTNPAPGGILPGPLAAAITRASGGAFNRLRNKEACDSLFNDNPMNLHSGFILNEFIEYRWGQGVTGPGGTRPCDGAVAAWTTCCKHDPYVFICDRFLNLSSTDQELKLIHEGLHVASQAEDGTSSAGPSDPPNSPEIDGSVLAACK